MVTIIGPFAFGFELSFIVPPIIKVIIKYLFTIKKDRYYYILTIKKPVPKYNHMSSTFGITRFNLLKGCVIIAVISSIL